MNRKLLVTSSLVVVALMVSLSIAAAVYIPAENGGDSPGVSIQTYSQSIELSPEVLGFTEDDMTLFSEGINELESTDTYLYVYLDENSNLSAEVTATVDSGENKIETLWNGWRIYLSSEVIQMIIYGGDAASILASFVPGITVLGPAIIQVLRVSIYIAAQDYLDLDLLTDDYGGLYFDITYKDKKKILFITLTTTYPPRVTNAGFQ